jgi:hypothetical protein
MDAKTDATMGGLGELRERFRKLRRNAGYGGVESWDRAVEALARKMARKAGLGEPTPEQWVAAAEVATIECDQCHGRGTYCWGAVVNGVPTHSGPCFRCCGTGRQGQADFARNWGYDNFHRKIYL